MKLTLNGLHELVEVCCYWLEARRERLPDYLLESAVKDGNSALTKRRAFVEAIRDTWREHRHTRRGRGSSYNRHKNQFDGPLQRLLREVFVAVAETPPAPATLHDDIKFLETNKERVRPRHFTAAQARERALT